MQFLQQNMFAIPVSFAKHHNDMQAHCIELLEHTNGHMAIHPKFNKIITSLRTAVEDGLGNLDKEVTSHDNLLVAFRLSLLFFLAYKDGLHSCEKGNPYRNQK